jgi:hypothetical protein
MDIDPRIESDEEGYWITLPWSGDLYGPFDTYDEAEEELEIAWKENIMAEQPAWQWVEVAGQEPKIGDDIGTYHEVFDFTRESICMSDPEVAYIKSVTLDGKDVTNECIYANSYFGIVIVSVSPNTTIANPASVEFMTERGSVVITYDIATAVELNKDKAWIILP